MDLTTHTPSRHHPLAAALVAAMLVLGLATAASAAPVQGTAAGASLRIGHAPVVPAGSEAQGSLPNAQVIRATVALTPRDPSALSGYARAVSTPGSSLYHRYLTVAQFSTRFAPGAASVASVRAALQAQGLHPGPLSANGLSMDVTASAGAMSTAFATSFKRYRVSGGQTAFANTSAPALPTSVSGLVQGVIGLDSLQVPQPAGLQKTGSGDGRSASAGRQSTVAPGETQGCAGSAASGGYSAGQIASAYALTDLYTAGDAGAGTTIALFELEPYSAADVAAYQACYGTSASITNVAVDGGPGTGSGQGEAALDIEDVIGLAPSSSVLVYEGKNTGAAAIDTYRAIVTQDKAKVVSTSWGLCEPQEGSAAASAENTLFLEAATQGQTIFAASGDHGVKDCTSGTGSSTQTVDDPASQPYVTGVGGTSLTAIGPAPTESVWNSTWNTSTGTASGATGGGVSGFWGLQSYQQGFAIAQSAVTCIVPRGTSCREVPDVSADADIRTGYSIYYKGAWATFGGTSAAAPTWAALAALADSSTACAGKTVGFANPALYQAARTQYGTYFNDVTTGNNSFGGLTGFGAATGYDMTTGLGTPKGGPIAAAMCGTTWTPPVVTTTTTVAAPTPTPSPAPTVTLTRPAAQRATVGRLVRVQLHASDSAAQALTYKTTGLPVGLSVGKTTGLISGTPKRSGKEAVTIVVTDASGATAQGTIAFKVAGKPTITGGLTVSKGRPLLALKVGAGTNAPPIQSIVVVPSGAVRFARRASDLSRGLTVLNSAGHRLKSAAKLRGGDLVVTLRSAAVRSASLHITVPAISLMASKTAQRHSSAVLQSLTVTVTGVSVYRAAFRLR